MTETAYGFNKNKIDTAGELYRQCEVITPAIKRLIDRDGKLTLKQPEGKTTIKLNDDQTKARYKMTVKSKLSPNCIIYGDDLTALLYWLFE